MDILFANERQWKVVRRNREIFYLKSLTKLKLYKVSGIMTLVEICALSASSLLGEFYFCT